MDIHMQQALKKVQDWYAKASDWQKDLFSSYPLDHAEITCEYQYGISNEVISGKTARVTVSEGKLLLIKNYK